MEKTLKSLLSGRDPRTMVPIRTYDLLPGGKMECIPPSAKMTSPLMERSEQPHLQEGREVTEEVGEGIFSTEGQLDQEEACNRAWIQQKNQDTATNEIHSSCLTTVVVKWLTYGYIPVICHHCKKEVAKTAKKYEKIHLGNALHVGDGLLLSLCSSAS